MHDAKLLFFRVVLSAAILPALGCMQVAETTVTGNTSATDGKSIFELAKYLFDKNEFKNCEGTNLDPLDVVWTLNPSQLKVAEGIIEGLPKSEWSGAAIEFASDLEIEIPVRDRESITMYVFKLASESGDVVASSEIGASLLFCYQHVIQDLPRSRSYLERAANGGDSFAMRSLASMYLSGLIEDEDAKEKGQALIEKCRDLGNPQCQ